ncbi:hypothetical protein UVI_02015680 [Ustilaginoidea virens]|uniref:Uncharacterized protein n=1 Tax=Ustilaginoidea virens TaxID=1159556 RepID=A0A1B5KRW4_USTVR|nr:hypothetical protein UVI_02015680 [Ustilaginoidea virens]
MSPFLPPKVSVPLSTPAEPSKGPCKRPIPRREPNTSSNRRSSSISSWVKQILPANRPERRGTIRRQGYWAQHEQRHPEKYSSHHQQPGKPQNRRGATVGSDSIVGWNMAKDIPDNESINSHLLGQECGQDADRKWSWVSGEDAKYHTAENRNHGAMPTALDGDQSRVNFADEPSSSESPTVSTAELELIRAKQETRRLRKNLKESGDYLGVQGFNPQTGKLDVITPSGSDGSSLSQETRQKLHILQNTLQTARHAYKSVKENSKREADRIVRKREKERFRRLERKKEHVQNMSKTVTWKRHARQWSSAQEPNLSPIAQSATGTAPETCKLSQWQALYDNIPDEGQ